VTDDLEREPTPAADPTRSAPGVGPHETDPAAMATIESTADQPAPSEQAPTQPAPRATNAGRVWIALAVATVLLVLLIIFIAENSRSVTISFLGASGHISLALAMLIAAVVGAAVTLLAGTARILQLRLEVRRHRRAGREHSQP
jgi:lipopolysaccharide assembly protein A